MTVSLTELTTKRQLLLSLAGALLAAFGHPQPTAAEDFPAVYNSPAEQYFAPIPADEAAAKMQLPEGFRATVFAAEPDVQNPIAMAWDDRGRMWVAENYTYSDRTQRFDLSLRDRVLIFEDTDNDGRADSRKVFTDQVQMLTSVETGRGGVWLMCPPQLLFIPDADGDDVPDGPTQVMLDGFEVAQDNYHNFANGLRWGPDGWLYGRCGHSCPGRIGLPGTPDEDRIPLDGGIWRYHPQRQTVEAVCHGTTNPWGHDWDSQGELFFINTVNGHLWHLMPGAHLRESFGESMNPGVYERIDTVADHYHYDRSGNLSESRDDAADDLGGGHVHIGMMIYQHGQWPEKYRGKLFTLNMHGQRANVERLEREGAGFVGRHEPDFFIAVDPFFRAIDLSVGPDGNVFVIDWSDTGECHEHTGVHRTSGRIFKISYGEAREPGSVYKPWCLSGDGKLPTLWKEYQAGGTTPESLRELLRDPDEHVRAWAIRLLTDHWPLDTITGPRSDAVYPEDAATRAELVRLAREDQSGLVHLVLASTLQRLPVAERPALAAPLIEHAQYAADRDLPLLVWYGLIPLAEEHPDALVDLVKNTQWPTIARWATRSLASQIATNPRPVDRLLAVADENGTEVQKNVLLGLNDAFRGWRQAPQPESWPMFASTEAAKELPAVVRELNSLFGDGRALAELRGIALDETAELDARQQALESLIAARPDDLRALCESLVDVRTLNATAAKGLALFDDPQIGEQLARKYRRFHPDDRPNLLELLVSRRSFASSLLDVLADGKSGLPLSEITAVHARQIRSLGDDKLNDRLAAVWGEFRETPADRQKLMNDMKHLLSPEKLAHADLSAGRLLFDKTCAQCHMLYGEGSKVAPDLSGSQRANLEYLLENIVDPSAVVGKDYRMTNVYMKDGRVLSGLVVSRNSQVLILQTATEQQALRIEDIEETRETNLSPMPDGLLQNLTEDQVRSLVAYLMHPSQVPLP